MKKLLLFILAITGFALLQSVAYGEVAKKEKVVTNPYTLTVNQTSKQIDNFKLSNSVYVRIDDLLKSMNYSVKKNKSNYVLAMNKGKIGLGKTVSVFSGIKSKTTQSLEIKKNNVKFSIDSFSYTLPIVTYKNVDFIDLVKLAECMCFSYSMNNLNGILTIKTTEYAISPSTTEMTNSHVVITIIGNSFRKEVKLGDSDWVAYSSPIELTENMMISARYINKFGNILQTVKSEVNNIDVTPPKEPEISSNNTNPTKESIKITLTASDDDMDAIQYMINKDGNWKNYKKPVDISNNMVFSARTVDKAGNLSPVKEFEIKNLITKLSSDQLKALASSIVKINTYTINGTPINSGSGFVAKEGGIIVTNDHIMSMAYSAEVITSDGKAYKVSEVQDYDVSKDIAVLKVNDFPNITPLKLGYDLDVKVNEEVAMVGTSVANSENFFMTFLKQKDVSIERSNYKDMQTEVLTIPANSGGIVCDLYGEVVGIIDSQVNMGKPSHFIIPIADAKEMINTSNNHFTLEQILRKDISQLNDKTFMDYFFKCYNYFTYKNEQYHIYGTGDFSLKNILDDKTLIIYFNQPEYNLVMQMKKDNDLSAFETWVRNVLMDLKYFFPDTTVTLAVYYQQPFDSTLYNPSLDTIWLGKGTNKDTLVKLFGRCTYEHEKESIHWFY